MGCGLKYTYFMEIGQTKVSEEKSYCPEIQFLVYFLKLNRSNSVIAIGCMY